MGEYSWLYLGRISKHTGLESRVTQREWVKGKSALSSKSNRLNGEALVKLEERLKKRKHGDKSAWVELKRNPLCHLKKHDGENRRHTV